MKKIVKLTTGAIALVALIMGGLVLKAGGLDDFKLQYFFLTQHFHDQSHELADIRQQNIAPEENSRIELQQLLDGGPPKDGIPSIDNPQFDDASTTPFDEDELIVGVVVNGEAKAYPYGIMNWHEIVNDTVGGKNISVTYCPLCDTMVSFERGDTTFGVSGKLYQSCLVMFDRTDDTLYSQPWALGVVGANVNKSLERIPTIKTTLGEWLEKYPESKILSTETGHNRDYFRYPYGSYNTNERTIFPVRNQQALENHPKEIVSYIWEHDEQNIHNQFSGVSEQFTHKKIQEIGEKQMLFNQREIIVQWDKTLNTVVVKEFDGTIIPSSTAFSFVYPAFF